MHKIGQSGGVLVRRLGQFLKTGLPLMGNVLKLLAKNVLIPLGLIAAWSTTDEAIHKKIFGSTTTTLIIFNEEMNDIMKIVKYLEESGLLTNDVSQTIKKGRLLGMLLGTLGASLLRNLWTGKGTTAASQWRKRLETLAARANMPGQGKSRAGESTIRAGQDLIPSHPLTNFEIQKYYQNKPKYYGVYSRNNLPKIKYGTYVTNVDEYESIRIHWIALYANVNNIVYFDSFGV